MVGVVAIIDDELLSWREVTLDAIHPRCVGCGEDQFDVVAVTPVDHFFFCVSLHVVQDDV